MAYKAVIFGTDGIFKEIKPLYDAQVQRGNLEIVDVVDVNGKLGGGANNLPTMILCSFPLGFVFISA